jgi:hypothetical protein
MSLITGNKVKKHTSQGIVKKKRTKPTKEFVRTKTIRGKTFINI